MTDTIEKLKTSLAGLNREGSSADTRDIGIGITPAGAKKVAQYISTALTEVQERGGGEYYASGGGCSGVYIEEGKVIISEQRVLQILGLPSQSTDGTSIVSSLAVIAGMLSSLLSSIGDHKSGHPEGCRDYGNHSLVIDIEKLRNLALGRTSVREQG